MILRFTFAVLRSLLSGEKAETRLLWAWWNTRPLTVKGSFPLTPGRGNQAGEPWLSWGQGGKEGTPYLSHSPSRFWALFKQTLVEKEFLVQKLDQLKPQQ